MTGTTALYCRVSTSNQNPDRQHQQTKEYAPSRETEASERSEDELTRTDRNPADEQEDTER